MKWYNKFHKWNFTHILINLVKLLGKRISIGQLSIYLPVDFGWKLGNSYWSKRGIYPSDILTFARSDPVCGCLTSAPFSRRILTHSWYPLKQASCSGRIRSIPSRFTLCPASISWQSRSQSLDSTALCKSFTRNWPSNTFSLNSDSSIIHHSVLFVSATTNRFH